MKNGSHPEPTVFVIFGAGGDLAWRKRSTGHPVSALANERRKWYKTDVIRRSEAY